MSTCLFVGEVPDLASTVDVPPDTLTGRGKWRVFAGVALSRQALPTDPIGSVVLTLTHVIVGSAVQVESQSGTSLYNGTAASGTVVIPLQVYSAGSPLNELRIKVRKGSASPFYQPWETLATAIKGSASIYVAQIPDE